MQLKKSFTKGDDFQTLFNFIDRLDQYQLYSQSSKIIQIIQPLLKKFREVEDAFFHHQVSRVMILIYEKVERFKEFSSMRFNKLNSLLQFFSDRCEFDFDQIPLKSQSYIKNTVERDAKSEKIKQYFEEDGESKAKHQKKFPSVDVNEMVRRIVTYDISLPDPQNVCCSPVFYQNWEVTHSGLTLAPLLFVKDAKIGEVQRAVAALMNSKAGGTILIGCSVNEKDGKIIPRINSAKSKMNSQKYNEIMNDLLKRIENHLRPLEDRGERTFTYNFVPLKTDPFVERYTSDLYRIPRIIVGPHQLDYTTFIESKRQASSSEFSMHEVKKIDHNIYTLQKVTEKSIYSLVSYNFEHKWKRVQPHYQSKCEQPLRSHVYSDDQEDFIDENSSSSIKQINLGPLQKMKEVSGSASLLFSKYEHYFILIGSYVANKKEKVDEIINSLLKQFQKEKNEIEVLKLTYVSENEEERVACGVGLNLPSQQFHQKMKELDKMQLFSVESIINTIKLSGGALKQSHDQFGHWPEFYEIYSKCYSAETLACQYSISGKQVTNYVVGEAKEQAFVARIILDYFNNRSMFIPNEQILGSLHDMQY